ncbi:GGDEF domain-containing protein [Aestuariirhabdus sp. LZHN29]|uniref:GGDEF domain-containing protein n=1 Tax=Aestuariirhabdus sp. LZHN29 TaxID=3417462 RepID=UPI003CE7C674
MSDIQTLIETLKANEEIARKLFDIEVSILSSAHSDDLFEKLIKLIKSSFDIPFAWLTLVRDNPIPNLGEKFSNSYWLQHHLHSLDSSELEALQTLDSKPMLSNSMDELSHLIPSHYFGEVRSLAVIPLILEKKLVGAIMLGDSDSERYHPELGTFHLEQLSVKASLCLSNVISRERLEYLATRDPLTGLLNRREMEIHLQQELERCERYQASMSLLFIDCDRFKQINDQYGHDYGDAVLVHVAEGLNHLVRANDRVFRFAGDEFVVALANQNRYDARHVRQRIESYLATNPLLMNRKLVPISVTCGISAPSPEQAASVKDLLRDADHDLLRQKRQRDDHSDSAFQGVGE